MEKNEFIVILALEFTVTNIKHKYDGMMEKILALMLMVTHVKRKYNGKDGKEWISCSDVDGDKYNQGVCIANTASVIHGRL